MERRGVGKRLTDGQRVEIIKLFDSGAAVTEADIARRYGVSRSAIWRLRRSSSHIMERYQEGDVESRDERRRGSLGSSSSSSRQQFPTGAGASSVVRAALVAPVTNLQVDESEAMSVNVDALAAMTPGLTTTMLTSNNGHISSNNMGGGMMLGMMDQGQHHVVVSSGGGGMLGAGNMNMTTMAAAGGGARGRPRTTASSGAGADAVAMGGNDTRLFPSSSSLTSEMELNPSAFAPEPPALPLIYMTAKAISSVQSPGVLNWERLNGYDDANYFAIVNDGVSVLSDGTYQINIDLEHSAPRQNYKFVFKVWNGKKLIGQCGCPLRTKKEISLSVLEMRCKLPAHARLRVEFLAAGFAFHESRLVIRLVQ